MSILDKITTENLRYRRPEEPHPVRLNLSSKVETADPRYNGFTYETAYKTELNVATVWYANEAQFGGRASLARKELLHFLYGNVLNKLDYIRARCYDRDYARILEAVDELQKELVD